ncbi:hypothetical protein [Streptomyces flaveus]|uniref:hypothetical protein n=1 Tax=Streptomyces flaveus TaxID=66370 RepID=UPI0033256CA6
MPSIIDRLIGPERAARVIRPLVRELMTDDLLPESTAYRIACEGVLAGDPWLLAEPGQGWALRSDVTDPAPALLIIIRRDTDQLTVEDPYGQRHQIPLCALAAYELEQWCWMRPDDDPHHTR